MIRCISIDNCHAYNKNLITEQHRLRYREVIQKEHWENVFIFNEMEFDQYDNLATEYIVALNDNEEVIGVCRLYPTTLPFMLDQSFQFLFDKDIPKSPKVLEASRLVLDRSKLTKEERKPVIEKLMLAYMERGLQLNIKAYIGFMLPQIWESTFLRVGWDVKWLGPKCLLSNQKDTVRAGLMPVTKTMERKIRKTINIDYQVIENSNDVKKQYDAFMSEDAFKRKKVKEAA